MREVRIRPALAADLPRLVGLDHSCASDYVWQLDLEREPGQVGVTLREVRLPRAVRVLYPRDVYALPDEWKRQAEILVAEADGHPIGYTRFQERNGSSLLWILDLVVAPAARRQGLGGRLLAAVESQAAERSIRRVILEVSSKAHPGIRLAHKMGYEFCGYNDHYYPNGDVALFFGRSLREVRQG